MEKDIIKKIVRDAYKEIATTGSSCGYSCNKVLKPGGKIYLSDLESIMVELTK
jgi:hypothetical protein